MVKPLSDRLLRKREALLRSLSKSHKPLDHIHEESFASAAVDLQASRHKNLQMAVHRSIRNLLKLGLSFSQILDGSGVSASFLRQTFRELSLDIPKGNSSKQLEAKSSLPHGHSKSSGDLDRVETTSPQESTRLPSNEKDRTLNIDSELRLFMLKTRLETNRLRGLIKRPEARAQLSQVATRLAIQEVKEKMIANLEEFFHEMGAKGSEESTVSQIASESPSRIPKRTASDSSLALEGSRKKLSTAEPNSPPADRSAHQSTSPTVCNASEHELISTFILTSPPHATNARLPGAQSAALEQVSYQDLSSIPANRSYRISPWWPAIYRKKANPEHLALPCRPIPQLP